MPRAGAKVVHEGGCSRCGRCGREPYEVGAEDVGEAESKATSANTRSQRETLRSLAKHSTSLRAPQGRAGEALGTEGRRRADRGEARHNEACNTEDPIRSHAGVARPAKCAAPLGYGRASSR